MEQDQDLELQYLPWGLGRKSLQNLEEEQNLQNLITLDGALDLVGKAKGAGLFNLEQDLELQNLKC